MTNEEIGTRAKIEILEEIFQNCFQENSKTLALVEEYLTELRHQAMLKKGGLTEAGGEALVRDLFRKFIKADMNNQKIAEDLGISRERVRQIYDRVFGGEGFSYGVIKNLDWKSLKKITRKLGITREQIGERAKVTGATVSNVLAEDKRYITNGKTSRSHASVRILKAILEMIQEKIQDTLEATENILNSLDIDDQKEEN